MKREQIFDCIEHLNGLEDLKIIVNSVLSLLHTHLTYKTFTSYNLLLVWSHG